MLDLSPLANMTYYVVGLGLSGHAAVQALAAAKATVYAYNDGFAHGPSSLPEQVIYAKPQDVPWEYLDALVLSPGIPHIHPEPHHAAALAHQHGVPIVCDVDLLADCYLENIYIGVTGTNGKSTTTALLHHLLPHAKCAGNIGVPVCELADVHPGDPILLELSSYQLERTPHLQCDIAVLLNITPDHLNRHGSMDGYVQAKRHILLPLGVKQTVVIGIDTPDTKQIYQDICDDPAKVVIPISTQVKCEKGISIIDGVVFKEGDKIANLPHELPLQGPHNHQNIAAALAVMYALGDAVDLSHLLSFHGLPHRLERILNYDQIDIINDSKSTNVESTLSAIRALQDNNSELVLLLGGVPKETGLKGLEAYKNSIAHCYVYGRAKESFEAFLKKHCMDFTMCNDMSDAVHQAVSFLPIAQESHKTTLLFSPACSSYDEFKNFEERGQAFKDIVASLIPEGKRL